MLKRRYQWTAADLSSLFSAMTYTCPAGGGGLYCVRVFLGGTSNPLATPGSYFLQLEVNEVFLGEHELAVSGSPARIGLSWEHLLLLPTEELRILVLGGSEDLAVPVDVVLYQLEPEESGTGAGQVAVDHHYLEEDLLTFRDPQSRGISGGWIFAYPLADWNAGRTSTLYRVGSTRSGTLGVWLAPLLLDPGEYVLVYSAPGLEEVRTVNLTVTA